TEPYPGFPTDMQAQISALATIAKGKTVINENIFETRFKYVPELIKMGAKIEIENGRTAVISGVDSLCGASVNAMDLRGGASLVVAGLSANGITEINAVEHIKRGYENLLCTLKSIGASITELS
ncbi:MAG: UDP-N-acetylglucosamine 1-carboxyvinyltransferase, partial [Firmicutes bacterium]|nr:UDP-N-acetylglucosamine 1-carboxyvinyltransferase [Bacillota bacterium]